MWDTSGVTSKSGPPFSAAQYIVGAIAFVALNALVLLLTGNVGGGFLLGLAAFAGLAFLAKKAGR